MDKLKPKGKDFQIELDPLTFLVNDLEPGMRISNSSTEVETIFKGKNENSNGGGLKNIKNIINYLDSVNQILSIESRKQPELVGILDNSSLFEKNEHSEENADKVQQHTKNEENNIDILNYLENNQLKVDIKQNSCDNINYLELNSKAIPKRVESSTQTEEKVLVVSTTQTNYKINKSFMNIAATIIQREWRKYKGKKNSTELIYLHQLNEVQNIANLAIDKLELLKKKLENNSKRSDRGDLPIPKKAKVILYIDKNANLDNYIYFVNNLI